ncbi:membrane-targeted effector domain-containing toxin [Pseudomonas sp. 21LCFQ010]|uniref:membrane-targeted effector domain-containing toxin n=1 Tax=Pseudomonas sp. 21LCFQ010 TaxID=2957506 RepID=UPI0020982E9F|nr:membrane-targeted effector domain-containing toxin [Pseudomonas sp. 21LCFQ010]MCO8162666.1 membrane-targeted effector domain-containing toxin [Pseudomonas sp. 21LCFQ010]
MTLPSIPPITPQSLEARLIEQAARLDTHLQNLPALQVDEQRSNQAIASHLEQALKHYWNANDITGSLRYQSFAQLLQQSLRDELLLKVLDGELDRDYQLCLPSANPDHVDDSLVVHALYLGQEDQPGQPVHGALLFCREQGPCVLHLPGYGAEGFDTLDALRTQLLQWLNDRALRSLLLRNTTQEHQDLLQFMQADTDLEDEPYTAAQLIFAPLASDPFLHAIKQQITKQRRDVAYVCAQDEWRQRDPAAWHLGIQTALSLHGLIGPTAMLRLREAGQQLREQARAQPEWLRHASPRERQVYLDSLIDYEQARLALVSLMQGCSSAREFARSRMATRLQNELGYDLDPDQVLVTSRRLSPLGGEPYEVSRPLSEFALRGLHNNDLLVDSDLHSGTSLTLEGQSLAAAYPLLTTQWLAEAVEQLDLRARFGEAQRHIYGNAQVMYMMGEVIRNQIITQALSAQYQGHIQASDADLADRLQGKPGPVNVQAQQLQLGGQLMSEMLVFRLPRADGDGERLLLFARGIAGHQALQGFDNERQLLHELVSWSASPQLRQYLLEQTRVTQRPQLEKQLLELSQKAQPAPDLLGFVEHVSIDDALYAMTTAHARVRIDDQQQHTPGWYLSASVEHRRELQGLEDAIEALGRAYRLHPHTQVPDYEQFVRQLASRKINALLGLAEGSVDPDQVIINSPRETLSYRQMLRDGYDDSLGFFNAGADTQATFSGPDGIDLTPLSPEKVAGSVRGAWPSDAWIAQVKTTLLDPQSEGYAYRRRLSLLMTRLHMQHAALLALLKQQISDAQYAWLQQSIAMMAHSDAPSRQRYPVYPLQLRLDNPFIASGVPALGDVLTAANQALATGIPISRLETVQGCYILCPQGTSNPTQALLYTPGAPDGLEFRTLARFIPTLHHTGMSDYYKDRCRLAINRTLAFYFIDLKQRSDSLPPALPDKPYDDLHEICFDRVLLRKLRDVEETTTGRGDMIGKIVLNGIELVAVALTLPFPPASFAVGAVLALRDSALALQALSEGDQTAAGWHVLGAMFNTFGALGDANVGLKGFGALLRQFANRGPGNPAIAALKSAPAPLLHAQLRRAPGHDPQKLLASGHFSEQEVASLLRPLSSETPLAKLSQNHASNPAYAVNQSLQGTTPVASGHAKGVTRIDGKHYIALDGRVYEVQYDAGLRLWQIIDPGNPWAFFGKQPVRLNDHGQWQVLDRLQLRGGGKPRFQVLDSEPASAAPPVDVSSPYELPAKWKKQGIAIADRAWVAPDDIGLQLPADFFAPLFKEGREAYAVLRETLRKDAAEFFENITPAARPTLPALADDITADGLLKAVFEHSQGLVINETLQTVASKRLLIENMPRLAEQNVEIIYIEHLFTDMHRSKLQKYLTLGNQTKAGSFELKYHLNTVNQGKLLNATGDKYDYYHLIKIAHQHGIEVRPLSSTVSYNFSASTAPVHSQDPAALQKMSLFFASRLIDADKTLAPTRRWVALLNETRANSYRQVPGISELHGAISIRVRDVPRGQPTRITRDSAPQTGESLSNSDFLLEIPNARRRPPLSPSPSTSSSDTLLPEPSSLDWSLSELLQPPLANSSQTSTRASRLVVNPGEQGFQLDAAGQWQQVQAPDWPASAEPTALQRSLADPLYQMPEQHLETVHQLALFEHRGLNIYYSLPDESLATARSRFFNKRVQLQRDARQALLDQPLPVRPELPQVTAQDSPGELLDRLYAQNQGVVVCGSASSIGSKQFIIDNLPNLVERQVKTLYLEHLQLDMHQLDLDLFAEKGLMSKRLLHYLKHLDKQYLTDPARLYNFEQLVLKAREHGIEVRALDCVASYYLHNMQALGATTREQMFNYLAMRTIRRHQDVMGQHKWLALVGDSHASSFDNVPGLAELEPGISLRVFDMPPGESFGPASDPGHLVTTEHGGRKTFVRNDYALGLPSRNAMSRTLAEISQPAPIEVRLFSPGLFLIEDISGPQPVIVHRSRANRIERTAVQRNAQGKLYVDRESWGGTHLRPFDDFAALLLALRRMNMRQVS